jgi:hypothetical protein
MIILQPNSMPTEQFIRLTRDSLARVGFETTETPFVRQNPMLS